MYVSYEKNYIIYNIEMNDGSIDYIIFDVTNFTNDEKYRYDIMTTFCKSNNISIAIPENSTSNNVVVCKHMEDIYVFRFFYESDENYNLIKTVIMLNEFTTLFPRIISHNFQTYYVEEFLRNYRQLEICDLINEKLMNKIVENILCLHTFVFEENKYFSKKMSGKISKIYSNEIMRKNACDKHIIIEYVAYFDELFTNESCNLVCSHNDIHIGNIMINNENDIKLIDPEFLAYNHWLYDFANLLEETYVNLTKNNFQDCETKLYEIETNMIDKICSNTLYDISQVEKPLQMMKIYPNLWWYLWAIEKHFESGDDNYLLYAQMRLSRFKSLSGKK